jgi:6-phosphogluconolactonase
MKCPCVALALFAVLLAVVPAGAASQTELVFVGSGRKNIETFRLDLASGALTPLGQIAEIGNPSFLSIAPNHKFLYSISEGGNGISAFAIDAATGKLTLLNGQPAGGGGPCHVSVDAGGKNALIANYGSGSFAVFPLAENGTVQTVSAFMQDHGSSINLDRQSGPHAHCIVTGPGDRFAYGCDLGLDKVAIFKFDPAQGTLVLNEPAFAQVKPGAGPRHIAFHPDGQWAFIINEMASTITVFACDLTTGALREVQTVSTLVKGNAVPNTGAEVAVHPTGNFVYGSNRGDNSIAVFACNPETGQLTLLECDPTGGKTPRQFEIDPSGRYLLAANQDSNTVVVFSIDYTTGRLKVAGSQVQSDNPMCVRCMLASP